MLLGHLFGVLTADLTVLDQIDFVPYENLCDVLFSVLLYAIKPRSHILERVSVSDIEA